MNRSLLHTQSRPAPLAENVAHSFAASHALSIYQTNSIYTFIPKNACSTMRLSIALHNGAISRVEDANWIHNNNDTFRADLRSLLTARFAFVILRCPFSRLVSCYIDKIAGVTVEAWKLHGITGRVKEPLDLTFLDFVRMLQLAQVLRGNIHWRPQSDFLVYEHYDEYYCFEDFQRIADDLPQRVGLKIVDARSVTRHGVGSLRGVPVQNAHELSAFDIISMKRNGEVPTPESFYNEELLASVRQIYAADVALYANRCGDSKSLFPVS